MSVIPPYTPPRFLFSPHLETIYPSLVRRVSLQPYWRERIATPDDDFLDLDWLRQDSERLVIISHGLEGSSDRPYIKGMAKAFFARGYDVLAWNYRSCSGEINKQLRFYHSGATDDLDEVIQHAMGTNRYDNIFLAGFSLGGNLTLKYLGERKTDPIIRKAAVFSVPLNLQTSCAKIAEPSNWIYSRRFLKSLKKKIIQKNALFPELDIKALPHIKSLEAFDDYYTAPIHGFQHARHYYESCSAIHFLSGISIPTLLINAKNDPFLSEDCFPESMLKNHQVIRFEMPAQGGHVGFSQFTPSGLYWSEERALHFFAQ